MTEDASYWDWKQNYLLPALMLTKKLGQGGHTPAKIKFPVFSLSFPCAR